LAVFTIALAISFVFEPDDLGAEALPDDCEGEGVPGEAVVSAEEFVLVEEFVLEEVVFGEEFV